MGTTSQKLIYLSETKTQLKDMINYGLDTGEKITSETTFRNYVKSLFDAFIKTMTYPDVLYNNLPKVTGEGTSVTLNDTVYAPMRVELSPSELEQETTSGKNLAYTGWTEDFVERVNNSSLASLTTKDGKRCLKFDRTAGYPDYDTKYLFKTDWKENTQYTLSCDLFAEGTNAFADIQIRYTDGTSSDHRYDRTIDDWKKYTLVSESGKTIKDISTIYLSGVNYIDLDTFMIEEGSTATSYEPFTYGASPNPQYPQEIHTVSGENEISIRANSNLQSADELYQRMYDYNSEYVSEVIDGNINTIRFNPYAYRPLGGTMDFNCYDGWKENTQYTIRCLVKNVDGTNIYLQALYTDGTSTNVQIAGSTTEYRQLRFVTSSGKTIERLGFSYGNAGYWLLDKSSWYVGEGNVTNYPEYKGNKYPISLGDLEYCKIGDYEDEFMKPSGSNLFDVSTVNLNKGIDSSGNLGNNNNLSTSDYIQVQPNTSYYLSNTIGASYGRCCAYYDENKEFISAEIKTGQALINTSITTPNNTKYMRVACASGNENILMVNLGNTALPYEPYDNGKWYLKKNIGKVVLNGSETGWGNAGISTDEKLYRFRNSYIDSLSKENTPYISNKFIFKGYNSSLNVTEEGLYNTSSGARFFLWIDKNRVSGTTANDIKNWLSTNNVLIYYVLSTPTYTLLSDTLQTQLDNIQKAITYQDQTNVSQTNNDLPFVIKLSAIRDLSGIFEEI